CGRSVRRCARGSRQGWWRWLRRRLQRIGRRARAGGSCRRARAPEVRGRPWPNRCLRSRLQPAEPRALREGQTQPVPAVAFETDRTPWASLEGAGIMPAILAPRREVMVNDCLIFGQAGRTPPPTSERILNETRMAGHSQFKNIMHRKGRQDAQKSKLFGKLAREITVAAKMGLPDPAMNARLRAAIIAARQENMSKDSIDRAVKKAIGSEGENYDEIRYEGYGPGGVAVIVEALTDNRNRAASDIRSYFTKSGGNLGETGSVSFMFDRTGVIEYDSSAA